MAANRTGTAAVDDPVAEYVARYSNWGRWGAADEIGTANLITPAIVRDAARGVRTGQVIGLALPLDERGPQLGADGRFNCLRLSTATGTDHAAGSQRWRGAPLPRGFGYADDTIMMPVHSGTHWDALAHVFHDGLMYNGRPATDVSARGAAHGGVEHLGQTLVGRGVLLDVAGAQGITSLPDGHAIDAAQLDAAAEFGRVTVCEGDIVLLRTGHLGRGRQEGWGTYAGGDAPGLSFYAIPWLHAHGVAAVAADTWGVEVRPAELPDAYQPLHLVALVHMGLLLGEIFDFERLAQACAEAGRYEFLVSAPPLAITGASGAPPGPVAIL